MRRVLPVASTLIELVGFTLLLWGAWLIHAGLCAMVGGLLLAALGFVLDRPARTAE